MDIPETYKKPLKYFLIACSVLVVYSLIGFFLVPSLIQWKLPEIIKQETGRNSKVAKIHFNPFLLSASIKGFEIQEHQGQPFVAFDNFDIDINTFQSIKKTALVFDKVWLNKLFVRIAKQKNGDFNFHDLIKPKKEEKKPEEKGSVFPLIITKLSMTEGKVVFEDAHYAKPVKEDAIPINLDIDNFTTQADQKSRLGFSLALSSGGKLDWNGELGINPIHSAGKIKLDNLKLERISELALQDKISFGLKGSELFEADYDVRYSKKGLDLLISHSKLAIKEFQFAQKAQNNLSINVPAFSLEGAYKVSQTDNNLQFSADKNKIQIQDIKLDGLNPDKGLLKIVSVALEANYQGSLVGDKLALTSSQGLLGIKGVELSDKEQNKTLAKIPEITLAGIGFNLNNQEMNVDSVAVNDASFRAWLNQEGVINYQTLFANPQTVTGEQTETEAKPADSATASWIVNVNNLSLTNLGVEFEDKSMKKPVIFDAKPINFKLSKFSTKKSTKFPFQLSVGFNKTGLIDVKGDTVIEPLQLDSTVDIKTIALDKFQPYVDKFAHLDVIDGKFNINGKASVNMLEKDKLDVKFNGDTGISDLITRDRKLNKDLVKWKKLTLKGMDIDLLSNRYLAKALILEKPYARVTIRKDKTINFADIVVADKSKPEKVVKTTPSSKAGVKSSNSKPYFKLGKFQLIDGSSDFADLSLILPFAAPIKSLDGGASGISSDQKSEIKVELKGNAYDISPVDIKGVISPYLGNYNVDMSFQGMPMPLMSPYMAQFAGYKVEKGKLTLGLKYDIVDKKLTASNSILIDQFELGEKVENPDAVSLPLELAIALLKDSSGKIKIDVPITGSLEDPKLSVGGLIVDALLNVLTKIVTSPFNAIASLIGSEEDLSVIKFAAGDATLNQQEIAKLDGVAKALKERPVLSLEIKGAAFQDRDWPAMQDDALRDQFKQAKAAEMNEGDGKKTRAEYVELSDEDYKDMLADAFIEKFPALGEKSLLGTPKLSDPKSGDFYEVAQKRLSATIKPEPQRLKDLAAERAQVIAKYIVQKGGVANDRVFILDTAIDPKSDNKDIVSTLSLKTTN